jgi:transcriptional regulator with XRE-family HTH domain
MLDGKADFDRALGERIRAARERAGVKQDQLAQAVGLSRTSITNIERGRQGVQAHLLVRIAAVLGGPPADLLPRLAPEPSMPDKVRELEPNKRAWAERVMRSPQEDDDHAA